MRRLAPSWLAGYAGVIVLMTLMVNFAAQLGRNAYALTLPSMEDTLGLSHFQAGSLFTALSVLGTIGALVFGTLAPRYGTRLTVGLSTIACGVAMVLLGASPTFLLALVFSGLIGLAVQGSITPVMGLLSVWFDSRSRGTVAGFAAGGGGFSFIIIGVLVPWLTGRDSEDGWRHAWYALGAIVIATGVLSLLLLRDRPKTASGGPGRSGSWPMVAYKNRFVWLISGLALCAGWIEGSYATFFGTYLEEEGVSLSASGWLWILVGVLSIGSGVLWGNVSDRLGRGAGFQLSFLALGLGCLLFWIAPVMAGFVASAVLVGISFRAAYTICAASAGDYVSPHYSAAAFGLMGMGAGIGGATGPLVGGHVGDVTGTLGWVFALSAGAAAVAVLAGSLLRRPATPAEVPA